MTSPKPGQPARGSRTGRPIMALLDLLGQRWALRILWELQTGPYSFRALRKHCGDISPTVLNKRLAEMREADIVELRSGQGYALTVEGVALLASLAPLNEWAHRWARRMG